MSELYGKAKVATTRKEEIALQIQACASVFKASAIIKIHDEFHNDDAPLISAYEARDFAARVEELSKELLVEFNVENSDE